MLQIRKISSSGISSGIPEEMKWFQKVHTVNLHITNLYIWLGLHKNSCSHRTKVPKKTCDFVKVPKIGGGPPTPRGGSTRTFKIPYMP